MEKQELISNSDNSINRAYEATTVARTANIAVKASKAASQIEIAQSPDSRFSTVSEFNPSIVAAISS